MNSVAYRDGFQAWHEGVPPDDARIRDSHDPDEAARGWDDASNGALLRATDFLNDRPAADGGV
jgi:hypothetical protein